MAQPLYGIGDTVYLAESAGIGFLEAMTISAVTMSTGGWVYNIVFGPKLPAPPTFGDRIGYQADRVLYYDESEFMTFCDAADVIERVLQQRLTEIKQQRDARCQ